MSETCIKTIAVLFFIRFMTSITLKRTDGVNSNQGTRGVNLLEL